jgi:hypothetical protein
MAFRDDQPNISPARRRLGITTKPAPPRRTRYDDFINLDHLLLFFDDPNQSKPSSRANSPTGTGSGQGGRIKTTTYSLTQFLSVDGRRSRIRTSLDYDYTLFRNRLLADLQIPLDAVLYPPTNSGLRNVNSRNDFASMISQLQGSTQVVGSARDDLPTLVLWWDPMLQSPSSSQASRVPPAVPPPVQITITPTRASAGAQSSGQPPSTPSSGRMSVDMTPGRGSDGVPAVEIPEEEVPDADDFGTMMRNLSIGFDEDEELWAQICGFFSCNINAEEIPIPGILLALRPYQAYAVWKILTQFTRGFAGYMNSDDVGLGKTGVTLCVIAIFHQLQRQLVAAQDEWRRAEREGLDRLFLAAHLPRDSVQGDNDVCPTQRGRLQCPCKKGSMARQVVSLLPNRPTLIVVPPELIGNWVAEAEKWIDKQQGSPSAEIRWFVLHKSWENQREGKIERSQLNEMKTITRGGEDGRFLDYPDSRFLSHYIIIVSSAGIGRIKATFDAAGIRMSNRGNNSGGGSRGGGNRGGSNREANNYAAKFLPAFVFLDEFHNYCGANNSKFTVPFTYLKQTRICSHKPIAAIGMSTSCRSNPGTWRQFIAHSFYTKSRRQPVPFRIAGMASVQDFNRFRNIWDNMIKNFDRVAPKSVTDLTTFLKEFIPLMILARKKADTFRGARILQLQASDPVWISCNMRNEEVQMTFRTGTLSVQAWMKEEYAAHQQRETQKQALGQEADLVSQREFISRMGGTLLEGGGNTRNADAKAFYQLARRASTFPTVAHLVMRGEVDREWTLARALNIFSEKMTKRLYPPEDARLQTAKQSALRHLQQADSPPWWRYRQRLGDESAKFDRIKYTIDNILLPQSQLAPDAPDVNGPPPGDGTNIRHMLIFASTPLSSFLITMLLLENYLNEDRVAILYMHSKIPAAERWNYVSYMQSDCRPDDPVKIMVSTLELMSVGHNIQRANTVIITDVPSTEAEQNQAFGRVNRLGQVMDLGLYQLYDELNGAEEIWRKRLDNRVKLTRIGYDDFGMSVRSS